MRRSAAVRAVAILALALIVVCANMFGASSAYAADSLQVSITRAATGKLVMKKGSTYKLAAKASSGKLTYKSSKPKVASVTKKGVLRAKKPGGATIAVTAKSGSKKAVKKVKVTVVKASKFKKVKRLTAKVSAKSLEVGKSAKMNVVFKPAKASNKNVVFKSSAPAVASVDASGVISARKIGTAKITVTSCDNKKAKASVTITVKTAGSADGKKPGSSKLDMEDLAKLVDSGEVEATTADDGSIESINGKFTDAEVKTRADVVRVLNDSAALFGDGFEAEGSDIVIQSPGTVDNADTYYRYSPDVNGIPVEGSQVVVGVSENGEARSLISSYNDAINDVDTVATLSAEEAKASVRSEVRRELLAGLDTDSVDEDLPITMDAELVILNEPNLGNPALVYRVDVSTVKTNGGIEDYSDEVPASQSQEPTVVAPGEYDSSASGDEGDDFGYLVRIERTYYVYANGSVGSAGECMLVVDAFEDVGPDGESPATSGLITQEESSPWESVTMMGYKDLLGNPRTFRAQHHNWQTIRFRDSVRNIETYKLGNVEYFMHEDGKMERYPELPGSLLELPKSSVPNYQTAVSLQANMADVYDFYLQVLKRQSFDGNGSAIRMTYGDVIYENAYWSGGNQQFEFGMAKNYAAALDVVGHEFTHAVVNYVVGNGSNTTLTYKFESGALNEALSDVMGSLIEGKDRSSYGRWAVGEDVGSAMRRMDNPSALSVSKDDYGIEAFPSTYTGRAKVSFDKDNGGVHVNSTIFTHAAYKMMTDSRTSDIDDATWAKVFYYSLYLLPTDAKFRHARNAVIVSAGGLGFTESQMFAIYDAFDAVEITGDFRAPADPLVVDVKGSLESYSWEQLKSISNAIAMAGSDAAGLAVARRYNLVDADGKLQGDTKAITMANGTEAHVRILGFRHDDLASGGKAGITFEFADVPTSSRMNSAGPTNSGGWAGSEVRTWLNSDFLDQLPSDLRDQIVPVSKRTNNKGYVSSNDPSVVTAYPDRLWLLSMSEVYGELSSQSGNVPSYPAVYDAEGTQYKLYADQGVTASDYNFCKKTGGRRGWWLRSPYAGNKYYFRLVYFDGDWNSGYAYVYEGYAFGISPGFCF